MIVTVLITRKADFNGSYAVDALTAAGERVCVLDDPTTDEGQMVPARAQAREAATPASVATPQPASPSAPPPP